MAVRRLNKELIALERDPPSNISAGPINGDLFHWQGTLIGPNDTPFEGGVFFLDFYFPASYPLRPPIIRFITKIFHPNISPNGEICRAILNDGGPYLTTEKFLLFLVSLLDAPNDGEPANPEAADCYRQDREKYNSIVREYTQKYAM